MPPESMIVVVVDRVIVSTPPPAAVQTCPIFHPQTKLTQITLTSQTTTNDNEDPQQ